MAITTLDGIETTTDPFCIYRAGDYDPDLEAIGGDISISATTAEDFFEPSFATNGAISDCAWTHTQFIAGDFHYAGGCPTITSGIWTDPDRLGAASSIVPGWQYNYYGGAVLIPEDMGYQFYIGMVDVLISATSAFDGVDHQPFDLIDYGGECGFAGANFDYGGASFFQRMGVPVEVKLTVNYQDSVAFTVDQTVDLYLARSPYGSDDYTEGGLDTGTWLNQHTYGVDPDTFQGVYLASIPPGTGSFEVILDEATLNDYAWFDPTGYDGILRADRVWLYMIPQDVFGPSPGKLPPTPGTSYSEGHYGSPMEIMAEVTWRSAPVTVTTVDAFPGDGGAAASLVYAAPEATRGYEILTVDPTTIVNRAPLVPTDFDLDDNFGFEAAGMTLYDRFSGLAILRLSGTTGDGDFFNQRRHAKVQLSATGPTFLGHVTVTEQPFMFNMFDCQFTTTGLYALYDEGSIAELDPDDLSIVANNTTPGWCAGFGFDAHLLDWTYPDITVKAIAPGPSLSTFGTLSMPSDVVGDTYYLRCYTFAELGVGYTLLFHYPGGSGLWSVRIQAHDASYNVLGESTFEMNNSWDDEHAFMTLGYDGQPIVVGLFAPYINEDYETLNIYETRYAPVSLTGQVGDFVPLMQGFEPTTSFPVIATDSPSYSGRGGAYPAPRGSNEDNYNSDDIGCWWFANGNFAQADTTGGALDLAYSSDADILDWPSIISICSFGLLPLPNLAGGIDITERAFWRPRP